MVTRSNQTQSPLDKLVAAGKKKPPKRKNDAITSPAKTVTKKNKKPKGSPPTRASTRTSPAPSPAKTAPNPKKLLANEHYESDSADDASDNADNTKSKADDADYHSQDEDASEHDDSDSDDLDRPPTNKSHTASTVAASPTTRSASAVRAKEDEAAENTHVKTKKKRQKDRDVLERNGKAKWIGQTARNAVHIAAPYMGNGRRPKQHLYWAKSPKTFCATNLIERTPRLQKYAVDFGGPRQLAQVIAKEVVEHSRKARNKHIYQLKKLFFGNNSPFQIAKNVLEGQCKDRDQNYLPMTVDPKFSSTLKTPKDMADLLMSNRMHADPVFYPHFVSAFAAGTMTKMSKMPPITPFADMVTTTHEAHFRIEMWYCLTKQGKSCFAVLHSCFALLHCIAVSCFAVLHCFTCFCFAVLFCRVQALPQRRHVLSERAEVSRDEGVGEGGPPVKRRKSRNGEDGECTAA
jgi:hypothetical protein